MFVQINMQYYNSGKSKIKKGYKDFEVRKEFWNELVNFSKEDFVSYLNEDETLINTHKTEGFVEIITSIARTEEENNIVHDLEYCMWGSSISIENTAVSSSLIKRVAKIEQDYATFYSMKTHKPFKVKLSDKVLGKVKEGDEVLINILMNKQWIVVDIVE